MDKKPSKSALHRLPADVRKSLDSVPTSRAAWEDITPLARNEWICWVTSGKKVETRGIRIEKMHAKLNAGMRRPCCWEGCKHR